MKRWTLFVALTLALSLSGCAMLPEEEEFAKAPVIASNPLVDYKTVLVQSGDLFNQETLSCTYRAVTEQSLSFLIGDELISNIYVQKGDLVQAGDLLVELYMGDLEDRISQLEYSLRGIELDIVHAKQNREIELERHAILLSELTSEQLEALPSLLEIEKQWDDRIQSLKDRLYVETLRLEEYRLDKAQRQLVAGIEGTVTYVRNVKDGDRSVEGERFLRISDTRQNVFVGETKNHQYLSPGEHVSVKVNKMEYDAIVMTAEELGLVPKYDSDSAKQEVYFSLIDPVTELEAGDRGSVVITMDERFDTLFLPVSALVEADGRDAVYVKDEYGLKSIAYVEVGLKTPKSFEVLGGLEVGDAVIVK